MAYVNNQRTNTGLSLNFAQLLQTVTTRFANYRLYRTTVKELSALSDRELADLGLYRADIRALAIETTYGH